MSALASPPGVVEVKPHPLADLDEGGSIPATAQTSISLLPHPVAPKHHFLHGTRSHFSKLHVI